MIYYCTFQIADFCIHAGFFLGMGSANEKGRYNVAAALIGWDHTWNDPCTQYSNLKVGM